MTSEFHLSVEETLAKHMALTREKSFELWYTFVNRCDFIWVALAPKLTTHNENGTSVNMIELRQLCPRANLRQSQG